MTTKIKFNQSISGYTPFGDAFAYAPDDIADIEINLANAWVESGIASLVVKEKPKAEFAVKPAASAVTPKAAPVEAETKGE